MKQALPIALEANRQPENWSVFPVTSIPSSLTFDVSRFESVGSSDRILDLGCGTGKTSEELFKNGYTSIVGIDINELAVASASQNSRVLQGTRGAFVVGDIRCLPFATGSCDVGILQAVLTIIPTPQDRLLVLSEVHRVLFPGGKLYLCDFAQTWDSPLYRQRYL